MKGDLVPWGSLPSVRGGAFLFSSEVDMADSYNVAVVGATGAVGREMFKCLEERGFPVKKAIALASERSAGKIIEFAGKSLKVQVLSEQSFKGVDIALFSAGSEVSRVFAPIAARDGCVVIDNSSRWRLDGRTPLVVPEVNPEDLANHQGIIANPNCSTIQMVVALKPIMDEAGLKRVIVATYQAVSGTGQKAVDELAEQTKDILNIVEPQVKVYPHRIAFNCLPQIDSFLDDGYTKEEMKMVDETRKIMKQPALRISATCVRVPVFYGHSEAIWIETEKPISPEKARALLRASPGLLVEDEPAEGIYPMPLNAAGRDEVFVGRIRADLSCPNGLTMWVVADNLRKGAAANAVEIAELLLRDPEKSLKTSWDN